jgi:polyketide cyclase/dehydrase/lipid transport protein
MRFVAALAVVTLLGGGALAGEIRTTDVAGSDGNWQEARSVIDAPLAEVHGWLVDFDHWPQHFGDIQWAQTLSKRGDTAVIRFRSRIIGRVMTMGVGWNRDAIDYRGRGKNVYAQGKIRLRPLDGGHTEVVIQSSADVHGLAGAFATKGLKRQRAFKKMSADLASLEKLAGGRRM